LLEKFKKEMREAFSIVRDLLATLGFLTVCYLMYVSLILDK